ncbi:MAG: hypothetical protein ACHQNA_03900, partial [Acidimicrobiales bacterium]
MTAESRILGHYHDLRMIRRASPLSPSRRLAIHVERDELLAELDRLDRMADDLSRERIAILSRLDAIREQLWPRVGSCHGRRPRAHDQPILPAASAEARALR